jgi:glucosamine-6-phosphate deaminase
VFPAYLKVTEEELGYGTPVKVRVVADMQAIAGDMAAAMLKEIQDAAAQGRGATLIIPVGPVDQFPVLAKLVNEARISLRDTVFINMDEYLTDDEQWVAEEHPLSFRGYMKRAFYDRLDPALAPPPEHRVFPAPDDDGALQRLIDERGGVDACFGGIGINGHVAFNEPPDPDVTPHPPFGHPLPSSDEGRGQGEGCQPAMGSEVSNEFFAALPTRVLSLARETRTINSVTVGGGIEVVPRRAVTVGMKEILASRRLRFYCNRPWQSAVVRRVLHGPVTPACPASFLRTHADAMITVAEYVAQPPDIRLR